VTADDLYARKREAYKRIEEILREFDRPDHSHDKLLPRIRRDLWSWLKHLQTFPLSTKAGSRYGVFLQDYGDYKVETGFTARALYFSTKAQADDFVARVRAGIDQQELDTFVNEYSLPHERITIEDLRKRADEP
jgi:hypothetical protein